MMELRAVTKHYLQGQRTVQALRGVSLRIDAGEFVSIMGPSGSGKSTLMHLLGALDAPTSGEVLFQGRPLHRLPDRELALLRRTRIGFVFQFFNLVTTLTAVENVALPLLLGGQRRSRALKPAQEGLERVGLGARASHYPEQLSGGEMQRVAIARALVIDPEAVLCDEPTGNLDSATSADILNLLKSLPEPGKRSVVMVTHDAHAASYGKRIVHIKDGLLDYEEQVVQDNGTAIRPGPWVATRGLLP
ncbi:MAG TPA: ABC transporter ATP-binding protein [Gemmataceae bacterium]|nr:ABC transporter ATP-binding protein [Gemmataceae bacterium]